MSFMKTTSQKNWGWIGLAGCFVIWVCAAAAAPAGPVEILFGGRLAPAAGPAVCGLAVVAGDSGPQVAWMEGFGWVAAVGAGEEAAIGIPVGGGVEHSGGGAGGRGGGGVEHGRPDGAADLESRGRGAAGV